MKAIIHLIHSITGSIDSIVARALAHNNNRMIGRHGNLIFSLFSLKLTDCLPCDYKNKKKKKLREFRQRHLEYAIRRLLLSSTYSIMQPDGIRNVLRNINNNH